MSRATAVLAASLLAAAPGGPARADAGIRQITLPDALAWARAHHPRELAARARLEAARAAARIPGAQWAPRASVTAQAFAATANNSTASYANAYGIDLLRIGGTRADTDSMSPDASTLVAAGVRQEVFDFGRIAAQTTAAELGAEVEAARQAQTALDVDLAVEQAFFAVRTAESIAATAEAAFQRAQVARDTAARGVQSGLRRPVDLTRAEAELARDDVDRIRARAGVTSAQAMFAAVTGVPEQLLDVTGEPPAPPDVTSLDDALARAYRHDPQLVAADAAARQQAATTRAIDAELRPDLALTAAIDGRAGGATPTSGNPPVGDGFAPVVPNWDVGLVFTWPLTDGVVRARAAASRQLEVARHAEIDDTRAQLGADVAEGYEALVVAREQLPALQRALDAAVANFDQANARFQAGLDTQLELADALALRTDAEIQLDVGAFQLAVARARLGHLMGEAP